MADSTTIRIYQTGLSPYAGPIDGQDGPQTRRGVSVFQQGTGNPSVDGEIGPQTEHFCSILQSGCGVQADGLFGNGSNGGVRRAQDALRNAGSDPGGTDGVPGPQFIAAVRDFQSKNGLTVDGLFGPATGGALFGNAPPPGPPPPPGPGGAVGGDFDDVSSFQGDISWGAYRSQLSYAVVKASEGATYQDPFFGSGRVNAMRDAGVRPGFYHFLRPQGGRGGDSEANFFYGVVRNAGGFNGGDLWPIMDFEVTTLNPTDTLNYARQFVNRLRDLGLPGVILYTYPAFWVQSTPGPVGSYDNLGCPLWIATYGSRPIIPVAWTGAAGWQYTDSARTAGIGGSVDQSHGYAMPVL